MPTDSVHICKRITLKWWIHICCSRKIIWYSMYDFLKTISYREFKCSFRAIKRTTYSLVRARLLRSNDTQARVNGYLVVLSFCYCSGISYFDQFQNNKTLLTMLDNILLCRRRWKMSYNRSNDSCPFAFKYFKMVYTLANNIHTTMFESCALKLYFNRVFV